MQGCTSCQHLKLWYRYIIHKQKTLDPGSGSATPGEKIDRLYFLMVPVVAEVGILDAAVRHAVLSGQEPCTVLTHGSCCD